MEATMRKQQILKELEKEKRNNENLKEEIARLKALLEAELQAKENGCHRGNYCSACKHAVLIQTWGKTTCYCTYGQCEHFDKEWHLYDATLP